MALPKSTEGLALLGLLVELADAQVATGASAEGRTLHTPWRVLRSAIMGQARDLFGASFDFIGAEQEILASGSATTGRFRSGWRYLVPAKYAIRETEPRPAGPAVKSDPAAIERYARLAAPAASNTFKARRK